MQYDLELSKITDLMLYSAMQNNPSSILPLNHLFDDLSDKNYFNMHCNHIPMTR